MNTRREFDSSKSSLRLEGGISHSATKELSESEILQGLRNGEESILGYVYNLYSKDLFRFGLQYTTDKELVTDSIHDVFLRLITKRKLLKKVHSVKAYLFTSLYHQIIYYLDRRRHLDIKVSEIRQFEIVFSSESKTILEEENREKLTRVNAAIDKLTRKQRQAVLHYYADGFTHKEIAMIMGFGNTNSVAKLIARAMSSIQSLVGLK